MTGGKKQRLTDQSLVRLIDAANSGEVSSRKVSMCTSKRPYRTRELAMQSPYIRRAYLCPYCEHWHGTTKKARKREP